VGFVLAKSPSCAVELCDEREKAVAPGLQEWGAKKRKRTPIKQARATMILSSGVIDVGEVITGEGLDWSNDAEAKIIRVLVPY
jgi:hypothetical protein